MSNENKGDFTLAGEPRTRTCRFCRGLFPVSQFVTNSRCRECVSKNRCIECGQPVSSAEDYQKNVRTCAACKATLKERNRARSRRDYQKHIERRKAAERIRAGDKAVKERKRAYSMAWRTSVKQQVLNHYGGFCACCGETEPVFLTIDHINNDGAIQRSIYPTDNWNYALRFGFPSDLRILCYNCNMGRAKNGGICPHETARRQTQEEAS